MNGVHDLGGMDGFGLVVPEANEPVFHSDWERRVFALTLASPILRNLDAGRHLTERMPPVEYLGSSYYEHWLYRLERSLIENGTLTREEIEEALSNPREAERHLTASLTKAAVSPHVAERPRKARFRVGDAILARNLNPPGHTRLPRYIRGHRGVIRRDWGVFTFPDSNAHGLGRKPQHCYCVEFTVRELWGADRPASERVFIDLWDDYLASATTAAKLPGGTKGGSGVRSVPARAPSKAIERSRPRAKPGAKRARRRQ